MLSKHAWFGDSSRGGDSFARSRDLVGGLASELVAAASSLLPHSEGCAGVRNCIARARVPRGQTSERCFAGRCAPAIRTTVSERRVRLVSTLAVALPTGKKTAQVQASPEESEQLEKQCQDSRKRWTDAAAEVLVPAALQAPLALLSPWSSLAGVAAAAVPAGLPPPPPSMLPPGLQEEEPFAALIFPGFDSSAFIWQITCWQVAEFVFSMWLGHNRANPTPCVLYQLGASWGPALARGQIWRLVTPVMLHANLTHLLFNVFFQLRMGFGMERQFGREKMMMIYFACGLFGNLMSVAVDPYKLAVGASTAGFGLIGVWLAEILLSWEILGPARERTVIWIVFMMISVTTMSSMTPNMDIFGHLGGALGGFLLSIAISDMKEEDRPEWYDQVRGAAVLGLIMCMGMGFTKAFMVNPTDPIPDCQIFKAISDALKAATASHGHMA